MKRVVILALLLAPMLGFAQGISKDESMNLARYDQLLDRVMRQNEQLMADQRALERKMAELQGQVQKATDKVFRVGDNQQEMANTVMKNQDATLKNLAERMVKVEQGVNDGWGMGQRDCPSLGVKHQQVKVTTRPDGARTVRFLCFDGKPIHLGTEVFDPSSD